MNFLEICRLVADRCNVSGVIAGTVDQTGDHARVVRRVNDAWLEIQQSSDIWRFMRKRFEFNTVAGKPNYTVPLVTESIKAGGLSQIRRYMFETRSAACWPLGNKAGRTFLGVWEFSDYEDAFIFGVTQPGAPSVLAVDESDTIWLGSIPDGIYTISGTVQLAASLLVASTDVPVMPEEFHMAIVYLAAMKISANDNLPEVYSEAEAGYKQVWGALERTEKEPITWGDPLA